jgi:hypothetical protein
LIGRSGQACPQAEAPVANAMAPPMPLAMNFLRSMLVSFVVLFD